MHLLALSDERANSHPTICVSNGAKRQFCQKDKMDLYYVHHKVYMVPFKDKANVPCDRIY